VTLPDKYPLAELSGKEIDDIEVVVGLVAVFVMFVRLWHIAKIMNAITGGDKKQ
jgi:hypothetical protein